MGNPTPDLLCAVWVPSAMDFCRRVKTRSEDTLHVRTLNDGRFVTGHSGSFKLWSTVDCLLHSVNLPGGGDVGCICPSTGDDNVLAVSVSSSILCYDLRNLGSPFRVLSHNTEEINQIAFHPSQSYLCSCDDAGDIKIISTHSYDVVGTLTGCHSNLCTCATFLPQAPLKVVSGGMDCKVVTWDWSRSKPLMEVSTVSGPQNGVNPPMVYSLDTWSQNEYVVCGLGNGVVSVYQVKDREIKLKCMSNVHTTMVVCVCCIDTGKGFVVSGGNDSRIAISVVDSDHGLRLVTNVRHCSKINWISVDLAGNIFVADQTHFVTVYRIRS